MDERELYDRWAAGDRAAGEQLIAATMKSLARYFANKVANGADADELVASTYERCARNLGRYRGEGSVRSYLFGLAYNVLREYLAKRRKDERIDFQTISVAELVPTPGHRLDEMRQRRRLLEGLRSLPLPTQIVLELHLFEELGRAEIAELLGLPQGTVASRLRRGRARLEEVLGGSLDH